ncbi:MAG TPA: hypothetical protein VF519_09695 [Mycobacteriales bacterium]|jgi:hypothetical protein
MTDERMDERLRDYAARWVAARPEPGTPPVPSAVPRRGGARWLPFAAAAAVVALVAGVAYVAAPGDPAPPVTEPAPGTPSPTATPTATPTVAPTGAPVVPVSSYPECRKGGVTAVALDFAEGSYGKRASVELRAAGPACRVTRSPAVTLLDGAGRDIGVTSRFTGPEGAFVLDGTPRSLLLDWVGPFCGTPAALRLRVQAGATTVDLPVGGERPPCSTATRESSKMFVQWGETECAAEAWRVVSASVAEREGRVRVDVVLRNVSLDFCATNDKPFLRVYAQDGTPLRLSHAMDSDLRHEPPLPPEGTLRASLWWRSYCGPALGAYPAEIRLFRAWVPFTPPEHPVPPCHPEGPRVDGAVYTEWLTPLP